MHLLTQRAFDRLVGLIYEAALQQVTWNDALAEISKSFDDAASLFYIFNPVNGETLFAATSEIHPEYQGSYVAHYASTNPYPAPAVTQIKTGQITIASDVVDAANAAQSEFYNDWMRPQKVSLHHLAVKLLHTEDRVCILGLSPRGSTYEAEVAHYRRAFDKLVPHLLRALSIQTALAKKGNAETVESNILDSLKVAVLGLDKSGRVVQANLAAERLLHADGPLSTDRSRRLRARVLAEDTKLQRAIGALFEPAVTPAAPHPVRLSSRRIDQAFACWVVPFGNFGGGTQRPPRDVLSALSTAPAVGLLVTRVRAFDTVPPEILKDLFGLTSKEALIAAHLASGCELQQIADKQGLARNTVRNHLTNIFAKTGTRRQAELVALLASLVRPF